MARAVVIIAVACLAWGACSERAICPAFQSAYIHDKEALRKKFSYFQEDTTPKILTASKNRYLVAQPVPYRKKVRQMQTVEMKAVMVEVPDSLLAGGDSAVTADELDRAARSVIDSTFIVDVNAEPVVSSAEDSVYIITRDREARILRYNAADSLEYDPVANRYVAQRPQYYVEHVGLNIDQDNYMWYLRDYLVLPDVKLAQARQAAEMEVAARTERRSKREGRGFLKGLFGKKTASDTTQTETVPPEEEFDFIDLDTLTEPVPPPEEEIELPTDPQTDFFGPVPTEPAPGEESPVADPVLPNVPRQDEDQDDGF